MLVCSLLSSMCSVGILQPTGVAVLHAAVALPTHRILTHARMHALTHSLTYSLIHSHSNQVSSGSSA